MDSIIRSILDLSSQDGNFGVLLILVILISVNGIKLTINMKVSIIYLLSYLLLLLGKINFLLYIVIVVLSLFIMNEIIIDDKNKQRLFGMPQRMFDYIYRLFAEYNFIFALFSALLLTANAVNENILGNIEYIRYVIYAISFVFQTKAILFVLEEKYKLSSVDDIVNAMDDERCHRVVTKNIKEKFNILCAIEDRGYLLRDVNKHTIVSREILQKIAKRLRVYHILHPLKTIKKYARGYGTIEMQMIRTLGIENGYNYIFRRKIFEVVYPSMVLNKLRKNRNLTSIDFKNWILWCYVYNVRVRINNKSLYKAPNEDKYDSIKEIFGKSIEKISNEQFFIWCLGLAHYHSIDASTVSIHHRIVDEFNLDIKVIYEELERLKRKKGF